MEVGFSFNVEIQGEDIKVESILDYDQLETVPENILQGLRSIVRQCDAILVRLGAVRDRYSFAQESYIVGATVLLGKQTTEVTLEGIESVYKQSGIGAFKAIVLAVKAYCIGAAKTVISKHKL